MAAYGLYTHIQSNKRRSIALLIGLFFLVYVLVFAGALLAEVLIDGDAPLDYLLRAARLRFHQGAALRDRRHRDLDPDRLLLPPVDDRRGHRRARGHARRRSRGSTISWKISASRAASPMPKLQHRRRRRAQRLRHRPQREAIFDHGDARPDRARSTTQELEAVLGHELTHIRNGDVRMLVIAVVIAGVISFFGELVFRLFFQSGFCGGGRALRRRRRPQGRRRARHPHRDRADRARLVAVDRHPLRAVALARISRRCRLGRTDQESRRHDLGAAQDRRPRRTAARHFGGDGNVRRQSARGLCRSVRHASVGRRAGRGAGEIRRRPRSRAAGAGGAGATDDQSGVGTAAGRARGAATRRSRRRAGPWGPEPGAARKAGPWGAPKR